MEGSLQTRLAVMCLGWGLVPGCQIWGFLCEEGIVAGFLLSQPVSLFVFSLGARSAPSPLYPTI